MFSTEFELTSHIALIVSHDHPSFSYVGFIAIHHLYDISRSRDVTSETADWSRPLCSAALLIGPEIMLVTLGVLKM